jgi:L-fuconolactonase
VGGNSISSDLNNGRYPHFEILAEADLVIDILNIPAVDVVALAKAVPSLKIVVDHMFNIRGTAAPSPQWRSDILTLSVPKNIIMKVSGLVEGLNSTQTDPDSALAQCTGALDHVYQSFGPDRLVFGTNWPVSQPKGEMSVVKEIVLKYFEPRGKDVLAKVFAGNAKKVYKYIDRKH